MSSFERQESVLMPNQNFFDIRVNRDKVQVFGDLRLSSLEQLTGALHHTVVVAGYSDLIIDCESVTSVTHSVIPPLAAYFRLLVRNYNAEFKVIPPRAPHANKCFTRLGLGHFLDHRQFQKPKTKAADSVLIQYFNDDERNAAVDKVMNSLLRTVDLDREHLSAIEWAVNEITDNVMTHAESKIGGFLICHVLAQKKIVEFTVADCGIGVARSLKIRDEREAVERAIQEGVTKNTSTNQGNGLFGTYKLALVSNGVFVLKSRHGNLYVTKNGEMHTKKDRVPFPGTFVVCQIDCNRPDLLKEAFVFGGRQHVPGFDYIEKKHESPQGTLKVNAAEISPTFGSRQSGQEARRYIRNLLRTDAGSVEIDFSGVSVISSSYADEVFGKLFVELGPVAFMRMIKIVNSVETIDHLIDRAVSLRVKTGLGDEK